MKGNRMAKSRLKNCRDCAEPIRMAQMSNGQWLPFDLGGGKHVCHGTSAIALMYPTSPFANSRPVNLDPDCHQASRWSAISTAAPSVESPSRLLLFLLLVFILLWQFVQWVATWWPW